MKFIKRKAYQLYKSHWTHTAYCHMQTQTCFGRWWPQYPGMKWGCFCQNDAFLQLAHLFVFIFAVCPADCQLSCLLIAVGQARRELTKLRQTFIGKAHWHFSNNEVSGGVPQRKLSKPHRGNTRRPGMAASFLLLVSHCYQLLLFFFLTY